MHQDETTAFLRPGQFIDSDHPAVIAFARQKATGGSAHERALALYYAVRDDIKYDPYVDLSDPASFRASGVLAAGRGFCVGKAALLAACCRAVGVPARVGYADVRNHLTSPRLYELMQTDVFLWHAYTELHLNGRFVKATPAFDRLLCERLGLPPLEFDGKTDSLFQAYDAQGRRRLEYLAWRGSFADVPFDLILSDLRRHYPAWFAAIAAIDGEFAAEAAQTPR